MGTLDDAAAYARAGIERQTQDELERQRVWEAAGEAVVRMAREFAQLALRENFPTEKTTDRKRPACWTVRLEYSSDPERHSTVLVFPDGTCRMGAIQQGSHWFTGKPKPRDWVPSAEAPREFSSTPEQVESDFRSAVAKYIREQAR